MNTFSCAPGEVQRLLTRLRDQWSWWVVALLLALLAQDMARVWPITNNHDLAIFIQAARRLAAGEDLYADAAPFVQALQAGSFSMKDETLAWPYIFTPLVAILLRPLASLPDASIEAAWWGLNVGSLFLGSWLVLRAMGAPRAGHVALGLLMLYRFEPAIVTLRLGQIELLQFLLLAFVFYALSRGREGAHARAWERAAGLVLGIAAGLKGIPLAFAGLLLWQRRWRPAAWAAGAFLVSFLGSFAVVGLDRLPDYLRWTSVYGIGGAFAAFPYNQSFNGFFSRNLIHNVFSPTLKGVHWPALAKGLTIACSAAVGLISAWLTWHPLCRARDVPVAQGTRNELNVPTPNAPAHDAQRLNLEFALAVAALLLVSPYSQVYILVWLLIPLLALAMWLLAQPRAAWWLWVGLFAAYALVGRVYTLYRPGLTRLVQAHYLLGMVLVWALVGFALWRSSWSGKRGYS